jgi:Xaa-Pro dipeptidase
LKATGRERQERIQEALAEHRLDALICALPLNVLMMSGYWPVVGTGVAIAFANGPVSLLIPEDEAALASSGWADDVQTFKPASLQSLESAADALATALANFGRGMHWRIGYESGYGSEPASYAAMHLYGGRMADLLRSSFPHSSVTPADTMLAELRARKTGEEIDRIRTACTIAGAAFAEAARTVVPGNTEAHVANVARNRLGDCLKSSPDIERADGFVWCMSGPNSALAAAAYARTQRRQIESGDLVLVHCNSYADGYWTDVTRTWCAGEQGARASAVFEAVFAAREAALAAIRPGASAASVDQAARQKMQEYGFGANFRHSTGHGVGFGAINAEARPRLHPLSPDTLLTGMVFNVEPAAYFKGYGGVRHCDVVAITERGCEVLTPFQCGKERALKTIT